VIDDDRGNPVHIKTQGVSEQQDQKERNGEGQIKTPEIPDQMIKLLARDSLDPSPVQFYYPKIAVVKRPVGVVTEEAITSGLVVLLGVTRRRSLFFCGSGRVFRLFGLGACFAVGAPPDFTSFRTLIPFSHAASSLII
jgi:hypothetical protein